MPRKPRFTLPGVPQHIVQRGNNRADCFFARSDYQRYLEDLAKSANRHDCAIHAYVLMTNHVHLLASSEEPYGISQMMQTLGRRYVAYINKRHERSGTLWEGRFKAALVDTDAYLLACMRYIELNPVRAGMVEHPGRYRWSSYAANALGRNDSAVAHHDVYLGLGSTPDRRQTAYRRLFDELMEDDLLDEIRVSLRNELVLGRADFKRRVLETSGRQVELGRPGRPRSRTCTDSSG